MADPTTIDGAHLVDWWTSGTAGSPKRVYSDAGSTLVNTDAQAIQQWVGVNATAMSQTTAANKLKWDAALGAVQNEYAADEWMTLLSTVSVNARASTIFFVLELLTLREAYTSSNQINHDLVITTSNQANLYYISDDVSVNQISAYDGGARSMTPPPYLHTTRLFLCFVLGASNTTVYIGSSSGTMTVLAANTDTIASLFNGTAGGSPLAAAIYDFGIYNVAESAGNVSSLFAWAQTRGVASSYSSNTVFDGDSETAGAGNTLNRNWVRKLGMPSGARQVNLAESGITVVTLSSQAASIADAQLTGDGKDTYVLFAGTNDMWSNGSTEAQLITNTKTLLNARKTAGWNKVIAIGMLPRDANGGNFTQTTWNSYQSDMRSAFDAATLGADAFVDVASDPSIGPWGTNDSTTYYASDKIHLNNAGSVILANLVYPHWAPLAGVTASSWTITGNGLGPYTAALVGSCTCNGTQKFTLSASGGKTITVTAPGGTITGNSTSSVTVIPAAGQTGFTFTASGTTTITPGHSTASNGGRGYVDPAAVSAVAPVLGIGVGLGIGIGMGLGSRNRFGISI